MPCSDAMTFMVCEIKKRRKLSNAVICTVRTKVRNDCLKNEGKLSAFLALSVHFGAIRNLIFKKVIAFS